MKKNIHKSLRGGQERYKQNSLTLNAQTEKEAGEHWEKKRKKIVTPPKLGPDRA